jgi:peptidoglycan/xylan/chitin deacetylase (PgdA/CDA1 family)
MRKWHWFIIVVFILSLSLLTACQKALLEQEPALSKEKEDVKKVENEQSSGGKNASDETDHAASTDQEQEANKTAEDPNEVETDKENEAGNDSGDQTNEEANVQPKRYKVNPNNYLIYPVEPVETGTQEENKAEEEKIVLLTFDDTPTGEATYQILDTLDKYKAKALFFVNGHYAEPNLDTLREIKNRGHLIGNHTWWHIYIRREDPQTVREEIVRLNDFLEEKLGERPKYFRPPFGQNSDVSIEIIKEEGMQTMNWSNGSLDWELKTPEAIAEQVLSTINSGDNILFHDKQKTADALDTILAQLTEQGYQFVLPTEVILPGEEG